MKEGKSRIRMSGHSAAAFFPAKMWEDSANTFTLGDVWIEFTPDQIIITKIKPKKKAKENTQEGEK
jgi:hypothetical protein